MPEPVENLQPTEERVPVRAYTGEVVTVPARQLQQALDQGYSQASQEELDAQRAKEYYGSGLQSVGAAGEAVLRGATLGLSDPLLAAVGGERHAAEMQARKEANPGIALAGDIGGMVGGAALTGGTSLLSRAASAPMRGLAAAGRGAEALTERAVGGLAERGLMGRVAAGVLPKVAGQATEGAIIGGGQYLSEAALGNHEVRGEELAQSMLLGGALGGALGLGTGLLGAGAKEVVRGAKGLLSGESTAIGDALMSRGSSLVEGADQRIQGLVNANKEAIEGFAESRAEKGLGGLLKEQRAIDRLSPEAREEGRRILLEEMPAKTGKRINSKEEQLAFLQSEHEAAGKAIGATGKALDELKYKPNLSRTADEIRAELDSKMGYAGSEEAREQLEKRLRKLEEHYGAKYEVDKESGELVRTRTALRQRFEDLHHERSLIDKEIKWARNNTMPILEDGLREVRSGLERGWIRDADAVVEHAQGKLGKELTAAATKEEREALQKQLTAIQKLTPDYMRNKLRYSALSAYKDAAERGVKGLEANRTAGLSEHLAGMAGGFAGSLMGGPVGSLVGAGVGGVGAWLTKHYGDQALAQAAHQLAHGATIREIASQFGRQMSSGVKEALGASGIVSKLGPAAGELHEMGGKALRQLTGAAQTSLDATVKAANAAGRASKVGGIRSLSAPQFNQIKAAIQERKDDPSIVTMEVMGTGVQHSHPKIARAAAIAQQRAIEYLASKLPIETSVPSLMGPRTLPASQQERDDFAKVLRAVLSPQTVLADLRDNTLTPEAVAAFRATSPERFAEVQSMVMEGLADAAAKGHQVPYERRLQYGYLLDIVPDPTLDPSYIRTMADAAATQGQGPEGPSPEQRHINNAAKAPASLSRQTPTQRRAL